MMLISEKCKSPRPYAFKEQEKTVKLGQKAQEEEGGERRSEK